MGVSGTSPESIAYQEGLRAVTSQEASLDELRSRSALLFTGMALATSFLGQNAISDGWGFWEVTAVIDLGVISLLITVILRPRDWRFRLDAERLVVDFVDQPNRTSTDEMLRDLALRHAANRVWNQDRLDHLMNLFNLALGLSFFLLVFLLAGLAGTILS